MHSTIPADTTRHAARPPAPSQTGARPSTRALLSRYLSVVNRALHERREEFPYAQLTKMIPAVDGDRRIAVEIYADDPERPHATFTVRFDGRAFELAPRDVADADRTWRIRERHLHHVVDVKRPAELDLDWPRTRTRGGAH
ncbi:MAG: hypothetical protein R3A79_07180 [Nannocystaceae bacterium]